jgi:hypothetical protein
LNPRAIRQAGPFTVTQSVTIVAGLYTSLNSAVSTACGLAVVQAGIRVRDVAVITFFTFIQGAVTANRIPCLAGI